MTRLKHLLQSAFPPTRDADPPHDLWPALRHRIAADPAQPRLSVPWFDWVLAGGVTIVAVACPAAIPLVFYYL